MAYIIDGNNVMGQTPGWHRDPAAARRRLLDRVAAFARIKKARITIVFDGAPDRDLPDSSGYRGVRVLYADRGSDADSRIERVVEASRDRRGLTVVTSDRRLAHAVRSLGASVIRSGEFRKLVDDAIETTGQVADGERFEVGNVNEWLRYFGALPTDDD